MNKAKQHIVFLAAWYPSRCDTMLGLFVQRHAQLMAEDYQISVIYPSYCKNIKTGIFTCVKNNVTEVNINIRTSIRIWKWTLFVLLHFKAYRYVLRKHGKPIINHVHVLTREGVMALIFKFLYGIPYIVSEHWSRYAFKNAFKGFLRKYLTKKVLEKASFILPVSDYLMNLLKEKNLLPQNVPTMVVRNVIDENKFFFVEQKNHFYEKKRELTWYEDISPDIPLIMNISVFDDKSKNLSGLLRAIKILQDKNLSFKLALVGYGPDFKHILKLAFDLGLFDRLILTGNVEPDQIPSLLNTVDFYVHPSNYETAGLAVAEAMMCGLPVVITRLPALLEFVDDKCGFIVEPNNYWELAYAIELMLEQYMEFDKNYIRNRAMSYFSKNIIKNKIISIYENFSN